MGNLRKVIVTCALTGAQQGKEANPNLPLQPGEIIAQGLDAWRAGASILHIHARDAEGKPTSDISVFRSISVGLKEKGCDAVLNMTTGGAIAGLPLMDRVKVVSELKPEIASFSVGGGSLLGRRDERKGNWGRDRFVQLFTSYSDLEKVARIFLDNGVRPELEVYHSGMLNNIKMLHEHGVLADPLLVNFVMGMAGEAFEATVKNLLYCVESIPQGAHWLVSAIGGKNHFRMIGAALAMGGNVRVGLEDNVYISPGKLASGNGEIVEKAVRIIRELGEEPATPDETKEILKLRRKTQ